MAEAADLVVLVADQACFATQVFRMNDEISFTKLLEDALFHYMRDPGWFEVTHEGRRFYACQLVTLPLLVFIKKRVPGRQLQSAAERALAQLKLYSDVSDPAAWIMINSDFLAPLPRPGVNLWQERKLKACLNRAIFTALDHLPEPESVSVQIPENTAAESAERKPLTEQRKNKNGPNEAKVMERVMLGWRVKEICEEQKCSESYIYKLIKKVKGSSAMDYRWKQWELIEGMYYAEPRMTLEEIEKVCGVSRAAIYQAVRKIAERDRKEITPRERERKLTPKDVEKIKNKLKGGALRKDICAEFSISAETLIKHIGTREDHAPVPADLKDYAVRLRVQGKTLQQTADILGVTVSTVKDAWRKMKNSPEINEKRVKYDNRNALSKRDRDQAVNAVLRDGHTRKQVYTQYGINALTLRRYIREALKKETDSLREQDKDRGGKDES